MKKLVTATIAIGFVSSVVATSAFAAYTLADVTGFSPSKGVTLQNTAAQVNTDAPGNDIYALGAKNAQGDTAYYSGSSTTRIYLDKVGVTGSLSVPEVSSADSTTDSSMFTGTAM